MEEFDVVVVGAGAAGMAAGLTLARALRSVVVFDGDETRNARADHSQGILGLDGASPASLTEVARSEVESFGGEIRGALVIGAEGDGVDHFVVTTAKGERIGCRQVMVANGVRDEIPTVPGVSELWGDRVVICPYCDGWEARGGAIAILGTSQKSIGQSQLLRQWTDRVTFYTNESFMLSADDAARLASRGIRVVEGAIDGVRRRRRGISVMMGDTAFEHDIIFTALAAHSRQPHRRRPRGGPGASPEWRFSPGRCQRRDERGRRLGGRQRGQPVAQVLDGCG